MERRIQRKILFIEPNEPPTANPVLDEVTRRMCAAFRQSKQSDYAFGGVHLCRCRAISSASDHFLPDGTMTNSLCIHYVAHHRDSVPLEELQQIAGFPWGESYPNQDELQGPEFIRSRTRQMIEKSLEKASTTATQIWCDWGLNIERLCETLWSVKSEEQVDGESLLFLLRFFSEQMPAMSAALEHLKWAPRDWGSESLQLPNWSRAAWLALMVQILRAGDLDTRARRHLASNFRYLRSPGLVPPPALLEMSKTGDADLNSAVMLAIDCMAQL